MQANRECIWIYIFTKPLYTNRVPLKINFYAEFIRFKFRVFSHRLVAISKLKRLVYPTVTKRENRWIHTFHNANSVVQDLKINFYAEFIRFKFRVFSHRLVAISKLKRLVYPTVTKRENRWIHTFHNANSVVQDLNSCRYPRFLWRYSLHHEHVGLLVFWCVLSNIKMIATQLRGLTSRKTRITHKDGRSWYIIS